ncbi:uncharacterized protein LOC116342095 isoform X2 [Contarinia nasturtii]|uniref:uncharacterized protein LOC116342095 isoform X2 n=1 Tax=Contarinia nasturtii TaxID=265458 RepID=UPI0012D3D0C5|nr:uncharacterized protein LOC116342095 isoform X2 [Contarinia nasturtii]
MKGKMGSGRSARLPPTPTHSSTIQRIRIEASTGYSTDSTPTADANINGSDLLQQSHVFDRISDHERQYILNVLERNNDVQQRDAARLVELKATSGEWISDLSREVQRTESHSNEYLSASEIIRKSIRRSWTISNSHQVYNNQSNVNRNGGVGESQRAFISAPVNSCDSNEYNYTTNNRTNHIVNHLQYPNMDYQNNEYYERTSPQRRVLRQSTLPSNLPHPDQYQYQNNINLMPPVSPNQQISPQYSPYNTDTEETMDASNPDLRQIRYPIRRQSTLPSRPSDHLYQQQQQPQQQQQQQQQQQNQYYLTTSPNRNYSRSPEKSDSEQQLHYPPPFVRQSTFPSNTSNEQQQFVANTHRPKILPTSPNRLYNRSPEHGSEPDFLKQRHLGVVRQNTLPNPDQHMKLLPTSPPKRQLSPQYKKRSPEMIRQSTLPCNPADNSLNVPQQTKFLPISPRLKQSFLFPQAKQNPRQFLSQQNVPTAATEDPYSSTGSVSCIPREQQVKMMKVRSHSNEEYSANRPFPPTEGRRLLPEIPRNRSRSPSRLVRQDNVKEDMRINEQRSPNKRTFVEAKQILPEYDDMNQMSAYNDGMYNSDNAFREADEDDTFDGQKQYPPNYYSSSDPKLQYDDDEMVHPMSTMCRPNVDNYMVDTQYSSPEESSWYGRKERSHRRRSREFTENEVMISTNEPDEHRRKPEAMRSISEDTPTRTAKQAVTRRTLSHPEKESHSQSPKIPSPKQFIDVMERSKKPSKIPSPRRKNYKSIDIPDTSPPGNRNHLHMQKRDSKSFDSGALYRPEMDDDSNGTSSMERIERMDRIERSDRSDSKIMLPTPPIRKSPANSVTAATAMSSSSSSGMTTANQSEDHSNMSVDHNKIEASNGARHSAVNEKVETEQTTSEPTEHKTTLGEAEIQSAVEAAAVIFKKVVLQRRQAAKKANEEGERVRNVSLMQDDVSDYEGSATLKMICPESDDYKLVFISSDSSSLDDVEDSSSTCSSTNRHSISLDDCDWDYFEPNTTATTKTIFRDCAIQSPFVSPNLQRRRMNIHADIHTTDEEFLAHSSSPTSSDGFVDIRRKLSRFKRTIRHSVNKSNTSCSGSRCDCGHQPQYVAIPVPVPIFVIGDDANSSDVRALQKKQAAELFQLWNTAAPLLAHQPHQRNHIESHKTIASELLKNYATQVETNTTPTHATLPNSVGQCSNSGGGSSSGCSKSNSNSSIAYADASSRNQENDTKQEETTLTTSGQSSCGNINDCNKHTNNGNINTCITTHNDRSKQMNSLSTGPTVDQCISTINVRTINDTEKKLNSEIKSRHFVATLKNELATNKMCDVTDANPLNCVIFNDHLDELSDLSHGIVKCDELQRKSNLNLPNNRSKVSVDQEKSAAVTAVAAVVVNESLSGFNLISDFSKTKSNSNHSNAISPIKANNKYRDLSKCSAMNRKTSDSVIPDDSGTGASDMAGYLRSEMFTSPSSSSSSSSCDSSSSDASDDDKQNNHSTSRSKSIKRNYDVLNAKTVKEKEKQSSISVSGSSDCEDLLSNSTRDRPSCSSAPEASDSDDNNFKKHSSLADRRPKSKGFYKVFVVNKKTGSSDSDSQSTNVNSTDDSSDNDTDTEKIVLNYIKPLPENGSETVNYIDDTTTESYDDIDQNDEIILCSIKRIDDDDGDNNGSNGSNGTNTTVPTCEQQNNNEPVFLGNDTKGKCNNVNDSNGDSNEINDEQSSEDENEQTVIERMPIDEKSCETDTKHKENAIMQRNEQVDLHNQSTAAATAAAADNINSHDSKNYTNRRANMNLNSERITDALRSQAKQMVHDLCATIEQKLNDKHEPFDQLLSQQMNSEINECKEIESNVSAMSCFEKLEEQQKQQQQQQHSMSVDTQNDRSQTQNESDVKNAMATIKTLETDPVSMNGFVCEQPVHSIHGVDDILSNDTTAVDDMKSEQEMLVHTNAEAIIQNAETINELQLQQHCDDAMHDKRMSDENELAKQTVLMHENDDNDNKKTFQIMEKSQPSSWCILSADNEAKVDIDDNTTTGLCVLNNGSGSGNVDRNTNETSFKTPNSLESAFDYQHTLTLDAQTHAEPKPMASCNEFSKHAEERVECIEYKIISADTIDLSDETKLFDLSEAYGDHAFHFPSTLPPPLPPLSPPPPVPHSVTNTNEDIPGVQTYECYDYFDGDDVNTQVDHNTHTEDNITRSTVENERLNSTDGYTSETITPAKYTSLVMITQDIRSPLATSNVNIVPTDTTHIVSDSDSSDSIIVQHTNRLSDDEYEPNSLAGYFTRSLEEDSLTTSTPTIKRRPIVTNHSNDFYYSEHLPNFENDSFTSSVFDSEMLKPRNYSANQMANTSANINSRSDENNAKNNDDVTVVTGKNTLSAVVCLEDGLADDDSWIGSGDEEDDFAAATATDSDTEYAEDLAMCSSVDREEELRGYNRTSIDFTLHTIVEESCEESEVEVNDKKRNRMSASELEKYFFFGLGDGKPSHLSSIDTRDDSISETSSLCSEGMDSIGASESSNGDVNAMASSRLEKYFLSTFMGFSANERDQNSDGSGSVGSDSEGHARSPEQRRKRLVRARGTPHRSHNSSLDNLLATKDDNHDSIVSNENPSLANDSNDSSETDTCDETVIHLEKDHANPNDTLKRKKQIKKKSSDSEDNKKSIGTVSDEESGKNSLTHDGYSAQSVANGATKKQSSRDSGFIGSNDDLLKNDDPHKIGSELKIELEEIKEETKENVSQQQQKQQQQHQYQHQQTNANQIPTPSTSLARKDSFNNYSSDEETNLMMSKLRQFVKTLVASNANAQRNNTSKSSTPMMSESNTPKNGTPVPKPRSKAKPPQLVYFENELTRLMKTVPGINDDQVREIVEYLSSEETWSDSYDSSDYTSSDLEGAASSTSKSELQEQISASCQQIIKKFEGSVGDPEGVIGDGGLFDEKQCLKRETALVYHKLVSSFSKISNEKQQKESNHSPPIFAKVMSHIGTRLVALMHEVSSSESHASHSSPKPSARYHKKLQQKISATTTDEDDEDIQTHANDNLIESPESYLNLPRSKSHDLLLSGTRLHHQSSSGVSDIAAEEKEASDYERFSWRGSFESALLANGDSRTKLTLLDRDNSSSASALAAKRRSAGDLLFNQCSLSREQLDRVRSCGSIGGAGSGSTDAVNNMESSKLWGSENNQRSSSHRPTFPDSDDTSSDEERRHHIMGNRSTLPRSLQQTTITSSSTNSLPRTTTTNAQSQKSQNTHQFLPNNVKSARYRPPGFSRLTSTPKKANSSLGLPSLYTKRDNTTRTRRIQSLYSEGVSSPEAGKSPIIGSRNDSKSSPIQPSSPAGTKLSPTSADWPAQSDEDIDRLVAMHQNRSSLSSLGLRSDSMASVYSGAGEGRYNTVIVKGQVEFGMQYNYKQGALEIHVMQCKDLAAVDTKRNRSDPYVKVYLLPDKSKNGKRKTKVRKHTLNPVFDETLKYFMSLNSLETRTLWLTVWHSDMFGRNDFLGEVTINLQGIVFDNPQPQWYTLQERSEPFDDLSTYRGDIIVGLKFVPPDSKSSHFSRSSISSGLRKFGSIKSSNNSRSSSSSSSSSKGSLHVLVKEAKNLSPVKANGMCDAFCKSYLLPDKNRNSKQKTPVAKRSVNPVWNYTFAYDDVSLNELSERALELTIWDHDRLASNEFLGGVRFSLGTGKYYGKSVDWMDSTGKELSLWQSMINRPNFWVEGCVVLRSSLDSATNTN